MSETIDCPKAEESPDNGAPQTPAPGAFCLRVLRRLELLGLQLDHGKLKQRYSAAGDSWIVGMDGEAYGPVPFRDVLQLLMDGHRSVEVLHASHAEEEEPAWTQLSYLPLWLREWPARLWTVGFWMVSAVLGATIVITLSPVSWRPGVDRLYWVGVTLAALWQWSWPRETVTGSRLWRKMRSRFTRQEAGSAVAPEIAAFWQQAARENAGTNLPEIEDARPAPEATRPAALVRMARAALFCAVALAVVWLATSGRDLPQLGAVREWAAPLLAWLSPSPAAPATPEPIRSEPPAQVQNHVAAAVRPAPVLSTEDVPEIPAFIPALADEPAAPPASAPSRQAASAPAPPRAAASGAPASALLTQPVRFPAILDGETIGSYDLPIGTVVRIVSIGSGQAVLEYQKARVTVSTLALNLNPAALSGR